MSMKFPLNLISKWKSEYKTSLWHCFRSDIFVTCDIFHYEYISDPIHPHSIQEDIMKVMNAF